MIPDYKKYDYYLVFIKQFDLEEIIDIADKYFENLHKRYKNIALYSPPNDLILNEMEMYYFYGPYLDKLSQKDFISYVAYNRFPQRLVVIELPKGTEFNAKAESCRFRTVLATVKATEEYACADYCYISESAHRGMQDIDFMQYSYYRQKGLIKGTEKWE